MSFNMRAPVKSRGVVRFLSSAMATTDGTKIASIFWAILRLLVSLTELKRNE